MRGKSTVPVPDTSSRSGFTYLEVLVALGILMALAAAVSVSLTRVIAAEQSILRVQEGALELRRLAAHRFAGDVVEAYTAAWSAEPVPDDDAPGWEIWRMEAADRPSLGFSAAFVSTGRAVPESP